MRLKLPGISLYMETERWRPGGRELSFNDSPRGGRVARNLSAIR